MANGQIGSNLSLNDFMHDAAMHQAWNQNWTLVGTTNGRMIQVDAYFAGATAGTGGAAAWKNGSNVSVTITDSVGAGSGTSGAWHTTTSDLPTTSSDTWQFGGGVSTGVWIPYHDNTGSTFVKSGFVSDATGGTNVSVYTGRTGEMGAYGTYFIIEVYQRVSGAWVKKFVTARRGGVNGTSYPTYVRRGGGWTQVAFQEIPFDYKPTPIRFQDGTDGLVVFEGPFYLGPDWAREMQLYPRQFEERQKQQRLVFTEVASQVINTVREVLKPKVWVLA